MDAKDNFFVFALLLLSLGLFGSLSLTYYVWNKQTEVASELQNELHSKLQSELQDKLLNIFQVALSSRTHVGASKPSQGLGQLKRDVRQADEDTDTPSATKILINALTEIIEMKIMSYMNCDKNEYNHTECTLKPGPKGEPGPEGEKGTKGEPGDVGHRGEAGNKGMKGDHGFPGYPGHPGYKGEKGVVGPQGPSGPNGSRGLPGMHGKDGLKGEVGPQGPSGPTGSRGLPGRHGKDGPKGEQGQVGPKGDNGARGLQGHTGEKGGKGDKGERGLKGDMGPPGPQGETGERGDTGQKGEPGNKGMEGNPGYKGEKGEQGVASPPGPQGPVAPTTTPTTALTTAPSTATPGQCGGPGWRRVVFLNMTNTSHVCPAGLRLTSYSRRTCGRANSRSGTCSSTSFRVVGSQYSRVCGRALAYQWGYNLAFYGHSVNRQGIDHSYVDGLSLTHGFPGARQHIWSFASGHFTGSSSSRHSSYRSWQCPCDNVNFYPSPSFVGNDYFCESVLNDYVLLSNYYLYLNATLWDGQICEGGGVCCHFNNPPWFTKNLTSPTTDRIELRLCLNNGASSSDIALELLELYVQ